MLDEARAERILAPSVGRRSRAAGATRSSTTCSPTRCSRGGAASSPRPRSPPSANALAKRGTDGPTVVAVGAGIVAAAMIALTAFAFAQRSEASKQRLRPRIRTTQYALGQRGSRRTGKETAQEQAASPAGLLRATRGRRVREGRATERARSRRQQSQAQAEQSPTRRRRRARRRGGTRVAAAGPEEQKALAVREKRQHETAQKQAQQYKILAE